MCLDAHIMFENINFWASCSCQLLCAYFISTFCQSPPSLVLCLPLELTWKFVCIELTWKFVYFEISIPKVGNTRNSKAKYLSPILELSSANNKITWEYPTIKSSMIYCSYTPSLHDCGYITNSCHILPCIFSILRNDKLMVKNPCLALKIFFPSCFGSDHRYHESRRI